MTLWKHFLSNLMKKKSFTLFYILNILSKIEEINKSILTNNKKFIF